MLNLTNHHLFLSQDVVFRESNFSFHSQDTPTIFPSQIYLPTVTSSCFDLINHSHDTNFFDVPSTNPSSDSSDNQSDSIPHHNTSLSDLHYLSNSNVFVATAYLDSYHCSNISTTKHWCN